MFALQVGSLLAAESVERVILAAERLQPSSPEWRQEVVQGCKDLADITLPDLSKNFGNALGFCTFGMWGFAFTFFGYCEQQPIRRWFGSVAGSSLTRWPDADLISPDRPGMFVLMLIFAFLPFGLASTVASCSENCDTLRHVLNHKRGEDLSDLETHNALAALETFMKELNRGQGL